MVYCGLKSNYDVILKCKFNFSAYKKITMLFHN